MRQLLMLLLLSLPAAAQQPVDVTACDVVQNLDKFDGKLVAIVSEVTRGPHDSYLVAEGCWPDQKEAEFVGIDSVHPETPGLKKFHKLFFKRAKLKNCYDCFKYNIRARFIGVIKKAPPGGFGAISAKVVLNIVDVCDIRAEKAPPPS